MASETQSATGFRQFRLFELFGFEVKLDLSWLLLGLLIGWSVGAGVFPSSYPDLPPTVYAWMGIAVALGVLFSIVFHEFAHSLVARGFGMPIRGITLFIFGGVAEMTEEPPSPKSELIVAVAGPIASFVLAAAFWMVFRAGSAGDWPVPLVGVCHTLAVINLTVAIFNLFPAFPLDGGRMLRAALWQARRDLRAATYVSSRIGRGFGLGLMLLGVIAFVGGNLIGGMWWFLIGMFVRGAATGSYQQLVLSETIQGQPVRRFMRRDPVTVPPDTPIDVWVEDYVYRHHYKMYPVIEGSTLLGSISIDSIRELPRERWSSRTVHDLMEPRSEKNTVTADMDTSKLLKDMVQQTGRTRYMVVEDGRLVGIIAMRDLLELLSLKLAIESGR